MCLMLFIAAFILVAFGQPAWIPAFGSVSAVCGYTLFWAGLVRYPEKKKRFWIAAFWFAAVQGVQLSWMISHPFAYIYVVLLFFALAIGAQFGLLGVLLNPKKITSGTHLLFLSAVWTLMEWSRLFFLSGYTWNPVGLALAGNVIPLQAASLAGVYGLSFLVMLTNFLGLRAWQLKFALRPAALWACVAFLPYLYGGLQYITHSTQMAKLETNPSREFSALLVQTAFSPEEIMCLKGFDAYCRHVCGEWDQILSILAKHRGKEIDAIVLPEVVVPFGTYSFVYSYDKIRDLFLKHFGPDSLSSLPNNALPLAYPQTTEAGEEWKVTNAYIIQALANIFHANVIAGLEDSQDVNGEREHYSSAIFIEPEVSRSSGTFSARRYSKRILIPMGEYIPFDLCKSLASRYGVAGSFTPGKEAGVWSCNQIPIGVSICYEETFGDMMRENRQRGAEILLNLTSDVWYPHSRLIRQHAEHARLRTVENGMPLLRSCNTGVTCAIDALGNDIAILGDDDATREDISDALYVKFPVYTYRTLYTFLGDSLIIGMSLLIALLYLRYR